jgi:hypothetical protein
MKALHKVNIMKRKQLYLQKENTKCYTKGYMSFVQVVKLEPTYQK